MNKVNQIQFLINKIRGKNVDLARILELISQDSQITTRQRALDGGSSAFGNINEFGWYTNFVAVQNYLGSNPGVVTTESKSGITSSESFETVASYQLYFPETVDYYKAKITLAKVDPVIYTEEQTINYSFTSTADVREGLAEASFTPTTPSGATLNGIELTVNRKAQDAADVIYDYSFYLTSGAHTSPDIKAGGNWPDTYEDKIYGSLTDKIFSSGNMPDGTDLQLLTASLVMHVEGFYHTAYVHSMGLRLSYSISSASYEARLKVGSKYSGTLALTGNGNGWVSVSHPKGLQTIELQARIVSGGGQLNAAVEQQTVSQQGVTHFI